MLVTKKTHQQTRLQNTLFLVLFVAVVGLLAWLSTRYSFDADWTANARNTLSEASTALLDQLDGEIAITSYATEDETLRRAVSDLVGRYQRHKADVKLEFINPDLVPDTIRQLGIRSNGELVIRYQGRSENLQSLSEQGITNTLQRLARQGERWLVFLSGHGERKPQGGANHDLDNWAQQLQTKGFQVQTHNLAEHPQLPDNTRVLVIANPQSNLLPGELDLITQYVYGGGNLLWLTDPGENADLSALAEALGVSVIPGVIVDPTTRVLGINDPRFAVVANYADHDITRNFDAITLFPQSSGLRLKANSGWQGQAFLRTETRSWSETGEISGSIRFDEGSDDMAGPLTVGLALSRTPTTETEEQARPEQQRIVVVGDGDFLSNAYLGNGGNLQLGMNIINWLAHDDVFIDIPLKTATDRSLELSPVAQAVIGMGFLFVIPALLAGSGFWIWWRRRKR